MHDLLLRLQTRKILLISTDVLIVFFSSLMVSILMGNGRIQPDSAFMMHCMLLVGCLTITRLLFKTYNSIWRFADTREYIYLICSDTIGFLFAVLIGRLCLGGQFCLLYTFIVFLLSLILVLCSRIVYKQWSRYFQQGQRIVQDCSQQTRRVAIVGAGRIGTMLLEEMQSSENHRYKPYCFFDNDRAKAGSYIHGIKVYDLEKDMLNTLKAMSISEVIIAIPSITAESQQRIMDICLEAGSRVKIYTCPFDRLTGQEDKPGRLNIRDIRIEDLLSREPVSLDLGMTKRLIHNRTILVTGGGGSIGSELCRQIAAMVPKKLVILDIYENSTYEIQRELLSHYGTEMKLVVEIATIRDAWKIDHIIARHRPDVVFHAAAHKHVPLMEDSCDEAIKNNVFGTLNVVNAAERYNVSKFILISSDKAVNPTNVMGATKRIGEMIIQSKYESKTEFAAVRFGNVLGSNGSVLPLFARQIACGGPVTITDKRVNRFFMTISEAVQLVLQTGAMAKQSEIYVLDMGRPVRIYDLAENMIKLAGLIPHKDIQITEIGLRPGEKLYEELLMNSNSLEKTSNEKIFVERGERISEQDLYQKIAILKKGIDSMDNQIIRQALKEVVSTYKDPEIVNSRVDIPRVSSVPERKEAIVSL